MPGFGKEGRRQRRQATAAAGTSPRPITIHPTTLRFISPHPASTPASPVAQPGMRLLLVSIGGGFSPQVYAEMQALEAAGILLVASAGNGTLSAYSERWGAVPAGCAARIAGHTASRTVHPPTHPVWLPPTTHAAHTHSHADARNQDATPVPDRNYPALYNTSNVICGAARDQSPGRRQRPLACHSHVRRHCLWRPCISGLPAGPWRSAPPSPCLHCSGRHACRG